MRSELHTKSLRSAKFTALSALATTVIYFAQFMVLARIFNPEYFGIIAIAMVVIGFAQIVSEMSLSEAIIQKKDLTVNLLSSLYWFNVVTGVIVFVLVLISAPLIATLMQMGELSTLLPVISISLVIGSFGTQFQAIFRKELKFGWLFVIDTAGAAIASIVTILSVWLWNQGIWAFVWGLLCGITVETAIAVHYACIRGILPRFYFSARGLKYFLSFGTFRSAGMLISNFNSRVDQILIGWLMGPQLLGYYNFSFNLTAQPIAKINPVITKVAFSVFSIVQDDLNRLRRGYLKMVSILMFFNAPIIFGIIAVAPLAIPLLFGSKWVVTIPVVQLLAVYSLIRSYGNASTNLFLAKGYASWSFYWNLGVFVIMPLVIYLSAKKGSIISVAWALVLFQAVLFLLSYFFMYSRVIKPFMGGLLKAVGAPLMFSIIMAGALFVLAPLLLGFSDWVQLLLLVLFGISIYLSLMWLFQKHFFLYLLSAIKS